MTTAHVDTLERLEALHADCRRTAAAFREQHGERIDGYRQLISEGVDDALARLRTEMDELSAGNTAVTDVGRELTSYVGWMQWSLWDLPVLAVALDPDPDAFREAVTGCGLVYIAIRGFDDVIDQHFTYKGQRETLLGSATAAYPEVLRARSLSTLGALLLCFEGLGRLAAGPLPVAAVVGSLRRAVVGAMMEHTPDARWSAEDYGRMVRLKNVDYWRALYAAIDPDRSSPLYPFLERYYELAQYLNDVEDYDEDILRGQPNLLAVAGNGGRCRAVDDPRPWAVDSGVEADLAERVLELGELAAGLADEHRQVAEAKLADLLADAGRLGLFAPAPAGDPAPPPAAPEPRLYPFSELRDVLEAGGPDAVVDVACSVCGEQERRRLFTKQGFHVHRCPACSHVYVSPRIEAGLHELVNRAHDDGGDPDRYLEVQRIYAEHICDLLRRRTPGARLLDVGFGRGYLLQMAQGYGFEAYGVDSSAAKVDPLHPRFGERVQRAVAGSDPLPWSGFDAVVLSHVLEHLPEPRRVLRELWEAMNPGAWLYVAVPDIDAMDYKVFGKHWDVISPLVHLQYFTERSLTAALEDCGFEDVQRIRLPVIRDEVAPRWVRLMRQLGGSESSELTVLARRPDDPAYFPVEP